MAEGDSPDVPSGGGGGIGGTLKQKYAGVPVWVWALLLTAGLAIYLIHKKNASASSAGGTSSTNATNLQDQQALANMFATAGQMPYQGGDIYINTPTTPTQSTPPSSPVSNPEKAKAGIDIAVSQFVRAPTGGSSWDALAKKYGVFGGNGAALYQYNQIANKHTAADIALIKKSPTSVPAHAPYLIAIPTKGFWINLPNVGTVQA